MSVTDHVRAEFAELFDFYRRSGFLYAGKSASLGKRLPVIEATWERLLAAGNDVFRLVTRRGPDGSALSNSICAFQYAPGTWQGQHLVSERRHEYVGTLSVLMELVRGFHVSDVQFARLSYRPGNPGASALFGGVPEVLPHEVANVSVVDYGMTSTAAVAVTGSDADVQVCRSDGSQARRFYGEILHPVELASLALRDLTFSELNRTYERHGLSRRRQAFVATAGDRVLGACLVHHSSEGMNFSFLENAIEHLRVVPGLPERQRARVWTALLGAAVAEVSQHRAHVVTTTEPGDRDLAIAAGLVTAAPKQYAVLTVSRDRDAFLRSIEHFAGYYDALLNTMAAHA